MDVVAFGSCRSALVAALRVLAPPGRVLAPAYTCVAVPNAVRTAGLEITWLDVAGANIDLDAVERTAQPGDLLLAQHTYGLPLDSRRLRQLADRGVTVLEDRAHRFDGDDVAGLASVYSFEHSKVVSAGIGGLVASADPALIESARRFRADLEPPAQAVSRRALRTSAVQISLAAAEPMLPSFASLARRVARRVPYLAAPSQDPSELSGGLVDVRSMDPVAAALGLLSLERLEANLRHRWDMCHYYQSELGELVPPWASVDRPLVRQPVLVADAEATTRRLRRHGVDLGVRWFEAPIHPRGSASSYTPGSAPNAEALATRVLSLPTHVRITPEMAARVVRAIRDAAA
ncbi:MAG: DegT/DnrJ/EryC1/StrS family aminotransferase [Chloroflexi bacterium]|nr:DegT/DnrJ/EryC1/StrS family aminotransferase [Chloroflexota bacterium]